MSIDDLLDSLIEERAASAPIATAKPAEQTETASQASGLRESGPGESDPQEVLQLRNQLQALCQDLNSLRAENDQLKSERRSLTQPAASNSAVSDADAVASSPGMAADQVPFPWKRHISTVEDCLRAKELRSGEAILKVLVDASQAISCEPSARVRLMTQLGRIRVERGELDEGLNTLTEAMKLIESSGSRNSMDAAFCLDAIAQCHHQRESFEEAEKLRRQAVVIGEELLGAEHPDVHGFRERLDKLRQDRNMANIGQDEASKTVLDRLSDAYNAAVAAGEDPTPPEQPSDNYSAFMVEKFIANGKTALSQKNIREAESQFRLAVDKAEAVDNRDARKLEAIRLLAGILESQNRDQEAKQLFERALTMAFRYIGWNDIQVAHALQSLADLHRKLGDVGLTKNYYKQCVATYSMTLGAEHETTVAAQAKYSDFLDSMKEETKWKGWSQ